MTPPDPTCGVGTLLPSGSLAMPKAPLPKAAHADRPERERKVLHELHDKKPGHVPRGPSWLKHHPHGIGQAHPLAGERVNQDELHVLFSRREVTGQIE